MAKDSYSSILNPAEGLFKDKGSKFLAFAYPVCSEEEVKEKVVNIKKQYHDARHHCYAYKIGLGDERYRMNDDGEPSGTAGKPIYGQILSNNLSDVLIVVVRYFGGTLLGTSGLINAYKNATLDCVNNAQIVQKVIKKSLILEFNYDLMSPVMRLVKDYGIEIQKQDFTETCVLNLNIRLNDYSMIVERFDDLYGVVVKE